MRRQILKLLDENGHVFLNSKEGTNITVNCYNSNQFELHGISNGGVSIVDTAKSSKHAMLKAVLHFKRSKQQINKII